MRILHIEKGGMHMAGPHKRAAGAYARAKEWLMEYAYLVTLGAVIAVVAATAIYTDRVKAAQEESLQAAAQAAEIAATATPQVTPLPTIAPLEFTASAYVPRIVSVKPVSGDIIRAYSREPVRWEALGVIQSHEGIDIAGEKDESVLSAMDGVVTKTALDALWGWRVIIAHTDGSEGTYAGLALSFVRAGQSVSRGQEIGLLMERVPCEAEMGPHLHLEWVKNGAKQDPEGMLPE